jgi:xanthine dehydrogenase accessory factor
MSHELLRLAGRWSEEGTPFVLATVVWRRQPSSGKPGAQALIDVSGSVQGWLGGACAEPTVIREALAALTDGKPRLLQLGPTEEFGGRVGDHVVSVPMACESEGAMEVYLEPVVPSPQLIVIGRSPGAEALVRMGEVLGWRATLVDDEAGHHPGVDNVIAELDLSPLEITERDFIVAATQGHYDEVALETALATGAGYVGLVASAKRAATVLEYLRGRGISDEALARVHAPAGLDLGSLPNEEIAVSVLAEMVGLKAQGGLTTGVRVTPPEEAIDPVCGMTVDIATAHFHSEHGGENYYFCAAGCQSTFEADPAQYVPA